MARFSNGYKLISMVAITKAAHRGKGGILPQAPA